MMIKKIFAVLLPTLLLSCTAKLDNLNTIDKNWEYKLGQEHEYYTSISETDFKPLANLDNLERLLPKQEGFIWIRNSFEIPKHLISKDISLLLGRITMADKTYLNGQFLGEGGNFPPQFFSNWNQFRYFPIPRTSILSNRKNVLLIKIYVAGEGSVTGDLILDQRDIVEKIYEKQELLNSNINIIISAILLVIAAYYFSIYFKRKSDKENLYFAVLSISTSIYLTNFFITKIPGFGDWELSYIFFQKIIFISVFISTYAFVGYIRTFLYIEKVKWQIILTKMVLFIPSIILLFPREYITLRTITNYLQLLIIIPLIQSIYYIFKSVLNKNSDTKILLLGISPFIFTVFFDLIVHQVLKFKVQKGDMLLLYSDCITEATNSSNLEYGVEGLIKSLETFKGNNPEKMIEHITSVFNKFIEDNPLKDDLTIIALGKI
ncbi:hypothetical protein EW093_11495 [Thiospirochaeta perfilievii]|uniref:PPM-type phosphatase domain-containing protein n=1 Tax=Thiospirochaeta perfilievii TaxID=252967 RepID=A0A5C1QE10_9SPIO|nr:SpoIIE family protein phosphatase [Thiospirochaeta perfilievii]QEN05310.1 hypothetical protein EW093_11495 [Thiospirochaeta perfilievii]